MGLPIILPTRTSSDLNSASDINALMTDIEYLYSIIFPVNSFYVQYPAEASNDDATAFPIADEPAELYGGTWTQLYDDEGSFFRTEASGGNADPAQIYENNALIDYRTNGLSKDKVQMVSGVLSQQGNRAGIASVSGAFSGAGSTYYAGTGTGGALPVTITFSQKTSVNARVTVDNAGKTEPQHRLMKLWRRTA